MGTCVCEMTAISYPLSTTELTHFSNRASCSEDGQFAVIKIRSLGVSYGTHSFNNYRFIHIIVPEVLQNFNADKAEFGL